MQTVRLHVAQGGERPRTFCFLLSVSGDGKSRNEKFQNSRADRYHTSLVSQNWKHLLCLEGLLLKIPVGIFYQLQFSQYPPGLIGCIDDHAENLWGGRHNQISHNCVHSCWVWQGVGNHAVDKRFSPYISLSEGLWWCLIGHSKQTGN